MYRLSPPALHGARHRGFTLIEFMIAITLSVLVLGALSAAFISSSRARNEIERVNQQIENGRYAMELLTDDLELAGFWGHFDVEVSIVLEFPLSVPAAKPDPCNVTLGNYGPPATELRGVMAVHVQGYDDVTGAAADLTALQLDCLLEGGASDVKEGTDIVLIRRLRTCVEGSADCADAAGAPYFQASLCGDGDELGSTNVSNHYRLDTDDAAMDLKQRNCATAAQTRRFVTHIYFITNNDAAGDGIPTLKRVELGADAGGIAFSDPVSLAQGIEDLQLEYGIDTLPAGALDGVPDAFTSDPDVHDGCAGPADPCSVTNWRNVTAVRVSLLARNLTPSPDYVDDKTYVLGEKTIAPADIPAGLKGFKRHAFQSTVRLMNPAGRRET